MDAGVHLFRFSYTFYLKIFFFKYPFKCQQAFEYSLRK